MKILIAIEHYLPGWRAGGPLRSVASMVERLADRFEFFIVTRDHDYAVSEAYPEAKAGSWVTVAEARVLYCPDRDLSLRHLLKIAREIRPSVIYLNGVFSPLTRKFLLLRRAGLLRGIRFVIAARGEFSPGALALKRAKKWAFLAAGSVSGLYRGLIWQASAHPEAQDIRRVMGDGCEIHVVPNLAGPSRLCSVDAPLRLPKAAGSVRLVFISRITRKKNLCAALEMLAKTPGEVEFDLFGPIEDEPYWKQCEDVIAVLPASVRVTYRGSVLPEDVVRTFSQYHFFMFPTLGENFGHVVLESLSAGCPVLLSDQTPWRRLDSKNAGWDLALADGAQWHTALAKCVAMNAAEHQRMAESAIQLASDWMRDNDSEALHVTLFAGRAAGPRKLQLESTR